MNIVLIGSGNVATVLGIKLKQAGHTMLQVYSRNSHTASALAYQLDTESANYKSVINKDADLYIICVADKAIESVIEDLFLPGKVVVHTAASIPMNILKPVSEYYGVFYPLQSLRKEMSKIPEIPIFYEGSNKRVVNMLQALAQEIAPGKNKQAAMEERIKLHVGAVLVSNFTNHLFALAYEYCKKEDVDFMFLMPLIKETVDRLSLYEPAQVQTGPAYREDEETIKKHVDLLENYPHIKKIYQQVTESIRHYK